MLGWIVCREGEAVTRGVCTVAGVPFYRVTAPPPTTLWRRYRWRRLLQGLRRQRVCCAVVEGALPAEMIRRCGVEEVSCLPLRRALLPQLLRWAEREWKLPLSGGTALLCAPGADDAAWRTALLLSRHARHVALQVETGEAVLARALRCRCGVGEGGGAPVLQVCLGRERVEEIPTIYLGENCVEAQKVTLTSPVAPGASEAMLSALYQAEKLGIDQVQLTFAEFRA